MLIETSWIMVYVNDYLNCINWLLRLASIQNFLDHIEYTIFALFKPTSMQSNYQYEMKIQTIPRQETSASKNRKMNFKLYIWPLKNGTFLLRNVSEYYIAFYLANK